MSTPTSPHEFHKPYEGLNLLISGAETDLGRICAVLLLAEAFPLAHLHLLYRRRRRGPDARARFQAFCRTSPLAAPLRAVFGPAPDEALADRVTVHSAAPARDDLGLGTETISALKSSIGAVIIAARSHRPDADPRVVVDRDLRHPLVIAQNFPSAALLLLTDVDAVSPAGIAAGAVVREADVPRNFDPTIETVRLARIALAGPRVGDRTATLDRRKAAFARARALGFATTGGYARALAEAMWLEKARMPDRLVRMGILRLGRPAPPAEAAFDGFTSDPHTLQALTRLVRLPLKHLPLDGTALLQLTPIDRGARQAIVALGALLRADAPRVLQAVPSPAADLSLGRALELTQLALRRVPGGPAPWREAFRRWVVAVPDAARAEADRARARDVAAQLRAGLTPLSTAQATTTGAAPGIVGSLAAAGIAWLDATGREVDAALAAGFAEADAWFSGPRCVFASERLDDLNRNFIAPNGDGFGALRAPVDWRTYFATAMPRALALANDARPPASGPGADARAAVTDLAQEAARAALGLWSRLRTP